MSAKNSIQVAIKVRPLLRKEKDMPFCWRVVDNSIQLIEGQTEPYYFDHIFDENANNQFIFDKMAKHIVHAGIQGFNGTIFAYGQTSSGKTYTMMGDPVNPGVMMLAIKEIFKEIERATDRQFLIRVGYIEIYNEKIFDLLNKKNQDLKIHETSTGIVSVNCEENIVTCEEDMLQNLCVGNKERTVGETNMNERSSRSHAIFRIIIESRKVDRSQDDAVIQSVLNLVDLAGSERADQTGARGARLKEGAHINKSLLFLSNVIKRLSENEDDKYDKYVSFRDSKLTRILQASLGGNALTSIICTIKSTAVEETQSTLNFALRAKAIKNKPQVNEIVSDATMMKRLEREVKDLKALLEEERSKNESKIKVGQLEQRIKDEDHKIISCNSLQYIRKQRDKRRRTWCPGVSSTVEEVTVQPSSIQQPTVASAPPVVAVPTKRPQLLKPNVYLTPHITLRDTPNEALPKFPVLGIQTDAHIAEVDEFFEPGEFCDFQKLSPQPRLSDESEKWNICRTPEPWEPANLRTLSLTPKATASVDVNLKKAESELKELQEFTNLENQIDVKHDTYDAMKQKLVTLTNRNEFLEKERLEHLEVEDELNLLRFNLNDSERRCNELQTQVEKLTKTNHSVSDKIAQYEKQIIELNTKFEKLEMENREAVSLEFEFQRHKNKSKLRETELLEALSEKNKEVSKLEKSLSTLTEEKLQWNKENHMHLSRNSDSIPISGVSDIPNGNSCVKCEDWQRMLEESKKVKLEFDELTLEYNKLQLNFNQATLDATEAKAKLAKLEALQHSDESECDKLRAEIATLRESLERLQHEYTQLNCDNHVKTEVSEKLNRELHAARDVMHFMQERYDKLEAVWQEQQKTISEIQMEYDAIQKKYQSLQAEYEKLEHTSQQSLEDCARLQSENEKLQVDINELKSRVEQARQKLMNDTGTGINERVEETNKLKKENNKLTEEVEDVQRQFDLLQKEYNVLSNQFMDSLQDGEVLREEYEKLELKLKMFEEKGNESQTEVVDKDELKFAALRISLENEIDNLKLQLEAALTKSANAREIQLSECSDSTNNELETCCSESMRSSGVCMENGGGGVELLMKFTKLMETLQEIELEHEVGKVRVFTATERLPEANAPKRKLLLRNFEEIVTHEHNDLNGHSANVCMQGMLKRHTFHIVELEPSETVGELDVFDSTDTLQWSKHNGNRNENSEHKIRNTEEEQQLRQELCQLNKTNAELRSLLESTEHEIRALREQINSLSAELFEKSQCLEKCACEDYQKQISSMQKELSGLSLINDFIDGVTSDMNKFTSDSDDSAEEEKLDETLAKAEQNECCKELQNGFDKQLRSLEAEFERKLRTKQAKVKEMAALLNTKDKMHQDEINRHKLELYEKLDLNENQFRENLRKYNREWEESKEDYETAIKILKEELEALKKELAQVRHDLGESQSQLKIATNKLIQYDKMFEEDPRTTEAYHLFKNMNSKLEAENIMLEANCVKAMKSIEAYEKEHKRHEDQMVKLKKLYKDSLDALSMYHEMERKFDEQRLMLNELRVDNNKLQVENENRMRENDLLNVEFPTLKKNLEEALEQKQQAEKELHAIMVNRAELLKTIQAQLQIISTLSQETENLKATLDDQETDMAFRDYKTEKSTSEEKLKSELKSESNYENTIEALQLEKCKLQTTLAELSLQNEDQRKQIDNIQSMQVQLISVLENKYEVDLQELQNGRVSLQLSVNQLENEKIDLQSIYESSLETQRQQKDQLDQILKDMSAKESKFMIDLEELQKKSSNQQLILNELEKEKSKYENDFKNLQKEKDNMQLMLDRLENEKSVSQSKYENSLEEVLRQQHDLFETEKSVLKSKYENDSEELRKETNTLQLALDQLNSEKSALEIKYENSLKTQQQQKDNLEQLESEISTLKSKYENSFETLEQEKADLQDELKSTIESHYEKNLMDLQKERDNLQLIVDQLQSDQSKYESEKSALESKYQNDLELLRKVKEDLQSTLNQIEKEKSALESKYEESLETQRQQRTQLDQLKSENFELESKYVNELVELRKGKDDLQLTLNQLESEKSAIQSRYENSLETQRNHLDQLESEKFAVESKYKNELVELRNRKDNLQLTLNQLESEKSALESKYEISLETERQQKNQLDQLENEKFTLESKYKNELVELRNKEESLQLTLNQLESEKSALESKYEKSLETERQQKNQLAEIESQKSSIESKYENDLKALRKEKDKFTKEKSAIEARYEKSVKELRQEKEALHNQLKNLKKKLSQLEAEKSALESKYENDLKSLRKNKQALLDQVKSEKSALETKCEKSIRFEKATIESKYENIVETLRLEKAELLDRSEKYEESLKTLRQENDNLQLTFEQLKKEKSCIEEQKETLRLKIDDLSQKLHSMKTKMVDYDQLVVDYEELEKAFDMINLEKHKLSLQIQTLEDALANALEFTQHMSKQQVKTVELEQQLQTAKAESIAAVEEQQSLRIQLETLKSKLASEKPALQCENKELQSSIAEMRIKCDSLQEANDQLQQTNANLSTQLKAAEVIASECEQLRTQLSTIKAEYAKLQLDIKANADEAVKCSDALRREITQQKQLVEQHVQSYNKLRTVLNSKETTYKDDKQKLEGTISCLLLEKKNLEDRLHLSEVALKRYENEFTASQLKFESANSSIEFMNTSNSPRNKRKSIERGTSEIHPLKSIIDGEDKISILQKKTLQMESVERKNRRLSTHDERRRQSLLGATHNAASMTEPFETKCTKCADLERKLKECETNLFINESRVTALKIELKNHPLKAENASLKKRLQEEQDKNRIEIKRYKQIILEKTTKATHALDSATAAAAIAVAAKETKICTNVETQTESELEASYQKLQGKYNDMVSICRHRYKYIMELEEKIEQKENTGDNRTISSLEAGQIKALKTECDLLKKELTVCKQKYEDAKKVLHKRREEIERLTALVGQR